MFEFTYSDNEILENYQEQRKAYKSGVYDFTFEGRYLIYHTRLRNKMDYIAIDIQTGHASHVKTVNPGELYSKASLRKLIPHILYSVKYTGDIRYLDLFADDPIDIIDSIFRVVLADNGYNIREEQISLSKKMYLGFTSKQVAICEAEVGTGKTLSYLVAALVAKHHNKRYYSQDMPVTITTANIELQKALVEKEIPNLSQMLMDYHIIDKPLTAVLRKGKDHHFCRLRFDDFMRNIKKYPTKYSNMIEALKPVGSLQYGVDLDKYRISGEMKSRVCVKGTCAGCTEKDRCEYHHYSEKVYNMKGLDFQVTNHNMYLMSQKNRRDDVPPLLRSSCFVVVDEAHKFREAAEDTFGERLGATDIIRYIDAVKILCRNNFDKDKFKELLKTLKKDNAALFTGLRMKHIGDEPSDDRSNIIALTPGQKKRIEKMLKTVEKIEKCRIKRNCGMAVTGDNLLSALTVFNQSGDNTIWLDVDENHYISLCSTPKNINKLMKKKVWDTDTSHVLTSGTMSDGTDFEYFKEENGLNRISKHLILESRTQSPFDYANHTRLYIPNGMPVPDNMDENYIPAIADEIKKIIRATNGHTAILFTSYKVLQKVYDILKDSLSAYDVICMTRGNKTAISDFKKAKNGILFASGSMWEGVDCVGDCLSSVIIVRLPFPMRNALMEEKKELCANTGDFVDRYCTPNMLIKLRQGVGRLIRCETDTGLITILDPRAKFRVYSQKVGAALSKYPRVESIKEITDFFDKVKSDSYKEVPTNE